MTTQVPDDTKIQSIKLNVSFLNDAKRAAIHLGLAENEILSISEILRRWLDASRNIYCASTEKEALAAAKALFASNPERDRKEI